MEWFRFYDEVLDDPKVQLLPAALFRDWVNILCLCNRNDPRGQLPSIDDVAFGLRCSNAKAKSIIKKLHAADLLVTAEQGVTYPSGWSKRQRVSDNVAERVAKHRARNVTGNDPCNVSGNQPEPLPHVRAAETETETETDLSPGGERGGEARIDDPPERVPPLSPVAPDRFEKRFGKPDPFLLVAAMCDAQGVNTTDLSERDIGAQSAIARKLVADGMNDEDVRRITTWLLSQPWVTSGVDMGLIAKQKSKWVLAGRPDRVEKPLQDRPPNMQISSDEHRFADDDYWSGGIGKPAS